ncbi:hypothetical protein PYCCODRAFT_1151618 [Trametes coccinea BRFM310]|uniref:F-box domain-containing protein n=1 Tax=Trametes coccinea (strain BRFM310) TaxID=1353009 RepID=A0A1Y2I813_TRAC3|nr:hypothetical protein PYCCODRAFT_1151618 [Trametes coccinea BRFM310]
MSEYLPNSQHVPLDVMEEILDHLAEDLFALRNCALVNTSLWFCTRTRLYRHITLTGRASKRIVLLARTLEENPTLGASIKALTTTRLRFDAHNPLFDLPFHRLSKLRNLRLQWLRINSPDEIFFVLSKLRTLERLECDMLFTNTNHAPPHDLHGSFPKIESLALPRLKCLVLKPGAWCDGLLAEGFLDRHRQSVDSLETIEISFGENAPETLPWISIIRAAAGSLRSVVISAADRPLPGCSDARDGLTLPAGYRSYHAYLMDTLAQCTVLESLTLKHRPFSFKHASSSQEFLESVCEVLERHPPPFPLLECLELSMIDREGAMISASPSLCSRLARILLDGSKYPLLRRIKLRVNPQIWLADSENWVARDGKVRLGDETNEQLVARWRAAFGALHGGSKVSFDVQLEA